VARRSTPRPSFDRPTVLRPPDVVHHLWGDDTAGYVGDEILLSSANLHVLIFTIPPGGRFGHSEQNRTIFGADETLFVLSGTLLLANPATGELCLAEEGDAIFFRRDTWHHGINRGRGPLRVLEMFAPTPTAGMSSAYAQAQPYLSTTCYTDDEIIGHWPMDRQAIADAATLHLIRRADQRLRLEGNLLAGLVCSTDQLTVTDSELLPGDVSDLRTHRGDALAYVTGGQLHVHTPDAEESNWWAVRTGDAFVIPEGYEYRLANQGPDPARLVLGSAPGYLASSGP